MRMLRPEVTFSPKGDSIKESEKRQDCPLLQSTGRLTKEVEDEEEVRTGKTAIRK